MVILSKPSVSSRIYFEDHDKVRKVRDEITSCMKKLLSFEEVHKEEMCDVKVGLCPIVSRAGTDIEAALSRHRADKLVIMMVLHHTFDRQAIVPNSSRYDRDNLLMVDVLFHEDDGLLKCPRNEEALNKAADHIKQRYPPPPASNGEQKKPHEAWTLLETISRNPQNLWILYQIVKGISQPRKFLNSIRQYWLVWIACLIITRYDKEPYREGLSSILIPNTFQKYLPSCFLQDWPLWVACLSVTLYTARYRRIQHSFKKHWFLWVVCTAVTLYNEARRH